MSFKLYLEMIRLVNEFNILNLSYFGVYLKCEKKIKKIWFELGRSEYIM